MPSPVRFINISKAFSENHSVCSAPASAKPVFSTASKAVRKRQCVEIDPVLLEGGKRENPMPANNDRPAEPAAAQALTRGGRHRSDVVVKRRHERRCLPNGQPRIGQAQFPRPQRVAELEVADIIGSIAHPRLQYCPLRVDAQLVGPDLALLDTVPEKAEVIRRNRHGGGANIISGHIAEPIERLVDRVVSAPVGTDVDRHVDHGNEGRTSYCLSLHSLRHALGLFNGRVLFT